MLKKMKSETLKSRSLRLINNRAEPPKNVRIFAQVHKVLLKPKERLAAKRIRQRLEEVKKKLQSNGKIALELESRLEICEKKQAKLNTLNALRTKLKSELTCTLSMSLFRDPVSTDCGSIYEREYIGRWLNSRQRLGMALIDPCMGVSITKKLMPSAALMKIVECVKENCFEWDIRLLEKALQRVQDVKKAIVMKKRFVKVTVLFGPEDNLIRKVYNLSRSITVTELKYRVVADEFGGFVNKNDDHSRSLQNHYFVVDKHTGIKLTDDMPLSACGLRSGLIFRMQKISDDYISSSDEEELSESHSSSSSEEHPSQYDRIRAMQSLRENLSFSRFRSHPPLHQLSARQLLGISEGH